MSFNMSLDTSFNYHLYELAITFQKINDIDIDIAQLEYYLQDMIE